MKMLDALSGSASRRTTARAAPRAPCKASASPALSAARAARIGAVVMACITTGSGCDIAPHTPPSATLHVADLLGGTDTLHARAIEPRSFTFPDDHGPHPQYRTEWWYFTGNLSAPDGRELGYQLTFFRSALADSASFAAVAGGVQEQSAWRTRQAYMAHFTVTDGGSGWFHTAERLARGAAGLGGAVVRDDSTVLHVGVEDWSAQSIGADAFPVRLTAASGGAAIDLVLDAGKPIVLQGERGLSRKGPEPGNASYYYSLTRMPTRGTVRTSAGTFDATGDSWLDREWSTNVLSEGVAGWDWLSLQLSDTTEVMMFRLRRDDRVRDPFDAATFVQPDGTARTFTAGEFTMTPTTRWTTADGVTYPVAWRVAIPALDLSLDVTAPIRQQELDLTVRYWEGMVRAQGARAGRAIGGRGYLEMTGYASAPDMGTR